MNFRQVKEKMRNELSMLRLNNTLILAQQELDLAKHFLETEVSKLSLESLERLSYLCLDGIDRIREIIRADKKRMFRELRANLKLANKKSGRLIRRSVRKGKVIKMDGLPNVPDEGIIGPELNH